MQYVFRSVTIEADAITDEVKRQAVRAWLYTTTRNEQPTEQEITDSLATWDQEETERLDLADLGQQVATELTYLDSTIAGIDGYSAGQVRDVVKRLCQEQRAELLALRYVVRRLM